MGYLHWYGGRDRNVMVADTNHNHTVQKQCFFFFEILNFNVWLFESGQHIQIDQQLELERLSFNKVMQV